MSVRVDGDSARSALNDLSAGITQAANLAIRAAVQAAEASAKHTNLFKNRTGITRGSIKGESLGPSGRVSAGGATRYLENGTRPHVIEAKGRSLSFVINGQRRFARRVFHPGTAERPFMRQARDEGEQALAYGADVFVGHAIQNAGR